VALLIGRVERAHRDAEALGIAPHLVERDQDVVAIEGGVLQPLGLQRPGVLLQLQGERLLLVGQGLGDVVRLARQQHRAQEVEHAALDGGIAPAGLGDGGFDDPGITPAGIGVA